MDKDEKKEELNKLLDELCCEPEIKDKVKELLRDAFLI